MKQLLSLLLCYILLTSQVFAISGGPVFGGGGVNPIGVYSGVITVTKVLDFVRDPVTNATLINPTTGQVETREDTSTASLGLFSLGVPSLNVAQGAFVQFVNGDVYIGTITASVDPDSATITGVVQGQSSFQRVSSTGTTTTTTTVLNSAAGKILAQITGSRANSLASARLNGTANLIINSGGNRVTGNSNQQGTLVQNFALQCVVSGYRQSQTYSSVGSVGSATTR